MRTGTEVDVVIPSWARDRKLKRMTQRCVHELRRRDPGIRFNVFVVETESALEPFQFEGTTTIYPKTEFGYNKFVNLGLEHCTADYVTICNNDLRFRSRWATRLLEAMREHGLQSASPFCPATHRDHWKLRRKRGKVEIGYRTQRHVAGWCLMQERSIYAKIGKLDERFVFWCSDDDYGKQLQAHGLRHGLVHDAVVVHLISRTLKTLDKGRRMQLTQGQYGKLKDKYGSCASAIRH
ncbi:MAG: glycosyltransferase family 2 protein [Planctomycetota bacterium]|nr:glycosyltransferase [Planctomycetota bacterium]